MFPERETETIEFKSEWTDRGLEDLAAFANHLGGALYMGIGDDGSVIGVPPNFDEDGLVNQVVHRLGIRPRIRWADQNVLVLEVAPSSVPIDLRGRYFTRVGSTNRQMTADQVTQHVMQRLGRSWDSIESKLGSDQASSDAISQFCSLAQKAPDDHVLDNLRLLQNTRLTNAAILLFDGRAIRRRAWQHHEPSVP